MIPKISLILWELFLKLLNEINYSYVTHNVDQFAYCVALKAYFDCLVSIQTEEVKAELLRIAMETSEKFKPVESVVQSNPHERN